MPGKVSYIPQTQASKDFWEQFAENNNSSVSSEQLDRIEAKLDRILNKTARLVIIPDQDMINKILLNSRRH